MLIPDAVAETYNVCLLFQCAGSLLLQAYGKS